MTTINIDWANVATTAAANFNDQVNQAAGGITLAISDLMADGSLNGPAKLAILQQVAATLSNKDALVAFFNGQAPKAPKALGGSPSGDSDDLQDELVAANARLRQLESDRTALEEALVVLGINRLMPDAMYDGNVVRNGVRGKVAEIQRVAAASVVPTNFVEKATVKAKIEEVKAKIGAQTTSVSQGGKITGKDAAIQAADAALAIVS